MDPNSDEEFREKAFQNIYQTFILPEIEMRQGKGQLPNPFYLSAAQILFFPDNKPKIIRLNQEVRAIALITPKSGFRKGKDYAVNEEDIEKIDKIILTEEDDLNCAHVFLMKMKKGWIFSFNFTYNKELSKKYIERGNEFLESAEDNYNKKYWGPFIDNLYSASELFASAILLLAPISKLKSHNAVLQRFHYFAHLGNINLNYSKTIKKLSQLRPKGRYMEGLLEISEIEAKEFLENTKSLKKEAEKRRD